MQQTLISQWIYFSIVVKADKTKSRIVSHVSAPWQRSPTHIDVTYFEAQKTKIRCNICAAILFLSHSLFLSLSFHFSLILLWIRLNLKLYHSSVCHNERTSPSLVSLVRQLMLHKFLINRISAVLLFLFISFSSLILVHAQKFIRTGMPLFVTIYLFRSKQTSVTFWNQRFAFGVPQNCCHYRIIFSPTLRQGGCNCFVIHGPHDEWVYTRLCINFLLLYQQLNTKESKHFSCIPHKIKLNSLHYDVPAKVFERHCLASMINVVEKRLTDQVLRAKFIEFLPSRCRLSNSQTSHRSR